MFQESLKTGTRTSPNSGSSLSLDFRFDLDLGFRRKRVRRKLGGRVSRVGPEATSDPRESQRVEKGLRKERVRVDYTDPE